MEKLLLLVMAVVMVGCGGDGTDGTMECYYCKEEIKRRALVCKHCGRDNSHGITSAELDRETEMSDRQRLIFQMDKTLQEEYKSGEISKSDYEHGVSWNNKKKQELMDDPAYDSDGNLKKKDNSQGEETGGTEVDESWVIWLCVFFLWDRFYMG